MGKEEEEDECLVLRVQEMGFGKGRWTDDLGCLLGEKRGQKEVGVRRDSIGGLEWRFVMEKKKKRV